MPLTRYQSRNEYGLADPELYQAADKDDPEALLEGVAMAGLVGILRQLGDLAEFAAEMFHDLHEEVMATASRSHRIMARVQQLEAEFPSVEKALLCQTDHSPFFSNKGMEWHPNLQLDQTVVTCGDLPRCVMDSYEECRGPPRLFLLDKFDISGAGACLKRYTDPSFVRLETSSCEETWDGIQREKKSHKAKRRASQWRNGGTPENALTSHAKLHELFLEEHLEARHSNPARVVKLKTRKLDGYSLNSKSGESYMEKFVQTRVNDKKDDEMITPKPGLLTWNMDNARDEVPGTTITKDSERNLNGKRRFLQHRSFSDDLTSEADNYVDAPATMESETEIDDECRMKNGNHPTYSDADEKRMDEPPHFSDVESDSRLPAEKNQESNMKLQKISLQMSSEGLGTALDNNDLDQSPMPSLSPLPSLDQSDRDTDTVTGADSQSSVADVDNQISVAEVSNFVGTTADVFVSEPQEDTLEKGLSMPAEVDGKVTSDFSTGGEKLIGDASPTYSKCDEDLDLLGLENAATDIVPKTDLSVSDDYADISSGYVDQAISLSSTTSISSLPWFSTNTYRSSSEAKEICDDTVVESDSKLLAENNQDSDIKLQKISLEVSSEGLGTDLDNNDLDEIPKPSLNQSDKDTESKSPCKSIHVDNCIDSVPVNNLNPLESVAIEQTDQMQTPCASHAFADEELLQSNVSGELEFVPQSASTENNQESGIKLQKIPLEESSEGLGTALGNNDLDQSPMPSLSPQQSLDQSDRDAETKSPYKSIHVDNCIDTLPVNNLNLLESVAIERTDQMQKTCASHAFADEELLQSNVSGGLELAPQSASPENNQESDIKLEKIPLEVSSEGLGTALGSNDLDQSLMPSLSPLPPLDQSDRDTETKSPSKSIHVDNCIDSLPVNNLNLLESVTFESTDQMQASCASHAFAVEKLLQSNVSSGLEFVPQSASTELYSPKQDLNTNSTFPSFGSISETTPPNQEDMPPLPPLPPMQWRIGKAPHSFPAFMGESIETNSLVPSAAPHIGSSLNFQTGSKPSELSVSLGNDNSEQLPGGFLNDASEAPQQSFIQFPSQFDNSEVVTMHNPRCIEDFGSEENNLLADHAAQNHELVHSQKLSLQLPQDLSTKYEDIKENTDVDVSKSPSDHHHCLEIKALMPIQSTKVEDQDHWVPDASNAEAAEPSNSSVKKIIHVSVGDAMWPVSAFSAAPTLDTNKREVVPTVKLPRPRSPLVDAVAAHDRRTMKKVSEMVQPPIKSKQDDKDSLLAQIRNKSVNLKRATLTRPSIPTVSKTNIRVAAILEKANTIRQAMAGSDEDEDSDSWSDS